jgi:hypothetical protein
MVMNPEESISYIEAIVDKHATPPGSYINLYAIFYKHAIPPGLKWFGQ